MYKACIISHNQTILSKIIQELDSNNQIQVVSSEFAEILVIVEPIELSSEYFTISTFWKIWLERFSPETKLISASFFEQSGDDNHIDLTNFPKDFATFAKKAKTVANMEARTVLGKDVSGKIRKFLDGHGEESLLKLITELKSLLDTMLFLLMEEAEIQQVLEATWHENGETKLRLLQNRMEAYKSYFQYLPLWGNYQEILIEIQKFRPDSEAGIQEFTEIISGWSEQLRQNFDIQER